MDLHVHSNPRLHYGLNGSVAPRSNDDGLQFLSVEEKECILFFEETIDSLQEEGLEEDCVGLSSRRLTSTEYLRTSASSAARRTPTTAISPSLMEHDIIDLVHSPPQFSMPDFQSQARFEWKPTRDTKDVPDSALTAPSAPFAPSADVSEESNHQPPPGSIPTPVVIASKLAEHQGSGSPSSLPSVLIESRRSLEAQRNSSPKCGPPTHAKPTRLPDNISLTRGNHEPSPLSLAVAAVNMQERRSQMLANLPSNAHPLEGGEPACVRNTPTRSVSFTDPTPNKSRMEALSKLGLRGTSAFTGSAASSKVESSGSSTANGGINKVGRSANVASSNAHTSIIHASNSPDTSSVIKATHSNHNSSYEPKPNSESNFNNYGGKSAIITAADLSASGNYNKSSAPLSPTLAEVSHRDFNSYGGKTIMLNPMMSSRSECVPSRGGVSSPTAKQEPADFLLNSYGGRSKVISPSAAPTDHSPTSGVLTRPNRSDPNSPTGVRSSVFPPTKANGQREARPLTNSLEAKPSHPDRASQPVVRARPATVPAPALLSPRPPRPSPSVSVHKPPMPPEVCSMHAPKPSLRLQGVTVQFSGKGTTEEARRDALRKLGLLRKTS